MTNFDRPLLQTNSQAKQKKTKKLIHFNENFRNYRTKLNVRNAQRLWIFFSHPVGLCGGGVCGKGGGRWLLREAVSQADAAAAKYINPRCGGLTRMGIAWGRPSPNRPSLPPLSTPFTTPKGHSRGWKRGQEKQPQNGSDNDTLWKHFYCWLYMRMSTVEARIIHMPWFNSKVLFKN